ncbi:RagB/SusD family nutrient uptake outer membrane protein [Parabacteroides sp. FAFU027]|uniref:RagB/SusD family nutrient uptake outer membrane protein n=1 Tax=Parabacteroides sp. FAFU027 TaxID=2922715 RepID=UPI001FAEC8B6|nr:RagB/SusD family nutrient uptake outer membrane protein [Parabacteroides sp. FAFU027]
MKTYKLITLALGAMISLNSCSDFLTTQITDPKKDITTYYKTPDDALTALTGCYNGLDLVYNSGVAFPVGSEVFSDNCFGATGATDGPGYQMIDEFNKTVSPSDISMFNDSWKAYYQAIYRCNVLINQVDGAKGDSSITFVNQIKAEAKFIRAYLYFDMVRLWGNIPLVITPTVENVPQAVPADVYAQIMSDLRYAADILKAAPYNSVASGRVTKWAAESLLARVYLFYDGYYGSGNQQTTIGGETAATALAAVEDVIAHSGHSLVPDFNTLWPAASAAKNVTYVGEANPEIVFSIKYSSTDNWSNGTGNHWLVMEGIRTQSVYPYQYGWGACTVDPKLYNSFTSGDSRQFASIIAIAEESLAFTNQKDQKEYTGYYLKKYSSLCDKNGNSLLTNFQTGPSQDYFVIRYSDVLLMAAELGSPKKQDYLDAVRTRAGLTSVAVSKAAILDERRHEFIGEGIRYWDLLRQGLETAATTIANNTTVSIFHNGGTPPTAEQFKAQIIATKGLQQIPDEQITLSSGTLKQNEGW